MAKQSYKIPEGLNKTYVDTEIPLSSRDGSISLKPLPIIYVLCYIMSIIFWLFIISKTFIGRAGFGVIVLFSLLWLFLTVVLLKRDKTGVAEGSLVISMINYLPKNMRRIWTRSSSNATDFYAFCGIEDIDDETGYIKFLDGTVGFAYSVVGTASVLLFDEDKTAILDRCDSFYRKMKPECEMIFITTKEPQKIYKQLSACKYRYDNLDSNEPDLADLADMNYKYIRNEVGMHFRSIHQYMILKANNNEALTVAQNILLSECENSSLVFKRCTALFGGDIKDLLKTIYRGKESI